MKRILPVPLGLALVLGCTEDGHPPLEPPLEAPPPNSP